MASSVYFQPESRFNSGEWRQQFADLTRKTMEMNERTAIQASTVQRWIDAQPEKFKGASGTIDKYGTRVMNDAFRKALAYTDKPVEQIAENYETEK